MTRLLRSGVVLATLDEGEWLAQDPALLQVLNSLRDPDGPSGAEPDPEASIARAAAERLGPSWSVETDDLPPYDPDVVY